MPVHDWTRVDAGTFHGFHTAWVTHLSETLNGGLLPSGYYALPEQHGGHLIADVLTLQAPSPVLPPLPPLAPDDGGVAVVESPPRVRRKMTPSSAARTARRTLTIRHISGHRVVALVEIVSPANKDRAAHVAEFADKAERALYEGIHLVVIDLVPPGPYDPQGMHGAIWDRFDDEPYPLPVNEPLTLASYVAGPRPEIYLEHLAVGSPLVEMPLFLNPDRYINLPLEPTYSAAYRGMPEFWREVLEGRRSPPQG
ncbi:MAG: DUF4058 family protein [Thermoguttaceae bacterium]|nr:DUF4058 family protein [Thermoguttaceae bacterium]